ncbi:hypothetical protein FRC09_008613, partial [Ceratobasidium sp. 395]
LVIESSKRLQPDSAETSAQTLQAMSQILIAISNGQPVNSSTSPSASPSQLPPSRLSVLVNTLWFLSLILSVAVSLVAMVSKSWCNTFMSNRSGSKYEQDRRRQRKWNAIETWGMENVFVYLPTLMHLALRLSVYLWDICVSVAVPVFFVTVIVVSLYAIATILPSVYRDCPYSTPLSKPLNKVLLLVDWTVLLCRLQSTARILPQTRRSSHDPIRPLVRQTILRTESTPMDKATSQMLLWLIRNCEDSQLVDIALQSIAGARPRFAIETLVEADVTKLLVQRLNNCFVSDSRMGIIGLRPGSSIEVVALYARALARLLEYDAGFRLSSAEHQVPQLDLRHLNNLSNPNRNETIAGLRSLFFCSFAEDDNIVTIANSIASPLYVRAIQLKHDQLIRSHLNEVAATDSRTLFTLLEAAPHWIIPQTVSTGKKGLCSSVVLLAQLLFSPLCSAPEFQHAIGLSLTVAAVLMHDYPGWEHPLNSIQDRATRAIEVYRYYRVEHDEEPKALVVSGLLGLLRGVSKTPATFRKDEVAVLTDVLTQIHDSRSVAGYRLHTFPDTLTVTQHAKMALLETLQAVTDGRSDFGEAALIPRLMQLLVKAGALSDSSICEAALKAFLGARSSTLRRICSKLLLECLWQLDYNFKDSNLEPDQINRLIDISLGDGAYSAPTAMRCLWRLTGWLIEAANEAPDGQPATVLADMLKHDAFTSLRAKAPDLPVSPRNIFEVGFAEMWYPLLKEMMSHGYAASIVDESRILGSMRGSFYDDEAKHAVPYLEELRDGRSWDDILSELN